MDSSFSLSICAFAIGISTILLSIILMDSSFSLSICTLAIGISTMILILLSIIVMDSSFSLSSCVFALGISTILGMLWFMVYRKLRSNPQLETMSPSSSSSSSSSLMVYRKLRSNPQLKTMSSSSSSPASSPPCSSSSPNWKHDVVFTSFSEIDIRISFVFRILEKFKSKGIQTSKFNLIHSKLTEAIRGSRIAIIVLSRNYASSPRYLNELVEIMKCMEELKQVVVPIFYELDPIDVRRQTGDFGILEKTCEGETKEDIGRWRRALAKVATIGGYHLRSWDSERDMIENIATDISDILKNLTLSSDLQGISNGLLHAVYIYCADTLQYSFASHLSVDFRRKRIAAFVNCYRTHVIEGASAFVVVISKDYLSSTSCLDKLVRVLQCRRKTGQLVIPVFYGISPSDVVVQEQESAYWITEWSSALHELRELPGHHSRKECSEQDLVEEIVKDVYEKLFPVQQIGISSRLLEIEQLLCKQPWGIRRIGIWGMPGIGKTTLAKAVFDQISGGYEASCFIKHFDKAFHEKGPHRLLEEHFGNILKELPRVCSSITRPSLPKDKINKKRALVVLDDVHNSLVAESFLGKFHWFGPGSLIIITSRDKQVYRHCQINHVYEVQSLNESEALQLFSQCAFGKDITEQKFLELSMELIDYTCGNPFALSFYGKELKGEKMSEIETSFLKVKLRTPYMIHDLFKSSYETLKDSEKNIFLDIACFFEGENVDYVMQLLEGCGFFPHVGIDVLVEKCLVNISENRVKMHNLIKDFGREIINGETVHIERRRRLWEPWSIKFLLEDDGLVANGDPKGTEDIEGIFLDTTNLLFDVKPTAFANMLNLRFLKIYHSNYRNLSGLRLRKGLESLPYELRLLHWENYPLQSLPQDFDPSHLVELNLSYSQLQKLWGGTKNLEMLKMVRLCHSQQLTEIDDICKAQNVELIDLQGCTNLQSFPATCQLQHLRVVNLSGCREIKNFPEVSPNIEELHLQGTGITELPVSTVTLSQQAKLNREPSNLPADFSGHSDVSNVERSTSLVKVNSSNQYLGKLVCLNMKDCSHLRSLPHMVDLESLKVLKMSGCSELEHIQGFPRNLKELYLAGTAIKELPQLPRSVEVLNAHGCVSLKSIPFGFKQFPRYCAFSNCFALSDQVVSEYIKNALAYVECTAKQYQQELNKSLAFSFSVSLPAKRKFTFHLQPGYSVLIQLSPSWKSTPVAFAILVEAAFSENATAFGFNCVCRWKDKEGLSHRLEKAFNCWSPGEGDQKFQKEHMFVFCDLDLHPSTSTGKDPDILADLIVFEIFPVDKQMELVDESCTVTRCGVYIINAANGDTSLDTSQPVLSLDRPKMLSDDEVEEVLRGLDEKDKTLFLYIACLFNDEEPDLVAPLIASIGLGISSGFKVLADNSLICISTYGVIVRHNLLRTMGREIVRRQFGELVGIEGREADMRSLSSLKSEEVKTVEISGPSGKGVVMIQASSPPSLMTSQDSGVSSNDQNHNSSSSRIELTGPILRHDQGDIYSKIGSHVARSDGVDSGESFKRDMRELEELLFKLNPMAEEFVPPSLTKEGGNGGFFTSAGSFFRNNGFGTAGNQNSGFRRKKNFDEGKQRMNAQTSMAQQEDVIRRTVYVSDLDQQVTEEQLAGLFVSCGQVVDCRICGDPNSVLRFAFIEFTDEEGAMTALNLSGTMLGFYPVKVLPSKTTIAPVNPTFLPRTEDEREMCARTIYCTNIDKKVTQSDVKIFFETICGEVCRLRLLGDYQHTTRIAFVEFVTAESAIAALNCSGIVLGSLPIRVSPSKTPLRPRSSRHPMH